MRFFGAEVTLKILDRYCVANCVLQLFHKIINLLWLDFAERVTPFHLNSQNNEQLK